MKALFLATPEFAIKFLDQLTTICEVAFVVTNPDMPSGRGQKITPSAVKTYALKKGIKVLTPNNPDEIIPQVKEANPDIIITVAYGKLLKKDFFSLAKFGALNVHFSLLPKYRGAAPIQWSIINGETSTGITIFEIDEGMDTGPIYKQVKTEIMPSDDAKTLREKLVLLAVGALKETLLEIKNATVKKTPQKGVPSYARILTKKDAEIKINSPAEEIHNKVRGLSLGPHPYVISSLKGKNLRVQILDTALVKDNFKGSNYKPGMIVNVERDLGFLVQCQSSLLLIKHVHPEGKNIISAWDFANGYNLKAGDVFCV